MEKKDFKIVFMGTPEFAVTILDALVQEGYPIAAVVTAPDKPAGRGQKLSESDVKKYAIEKELPLLQPSNLKDLDFITALQALKAELFVVVAFRMLPEAVWAMPPRGTINLHASLLPNYRGAAPINWAVINGETQSGVTTFFIEKEIDTGKVIDRAIESINENDTVGDLYDRLMKLGAKTTIATLDKIRSGKEEGIPQLQLTEGELKDAPKIFKPMCEIDWNKPVSEVHNFCRGLSPYPTAWCVLINNQTQEKRSFKLFKTEKTSIVVDNSHTLKVDKEGLLFPCSDYYLRVIELQAEGKRRMYFKDLLAGNAMEEYAVIVE